ncbi:hypothetical protein Btru_005726 [Bulinus truncatus]|nr:hypothetical protein Btru_005726 [Bulinus truncatus]
MRLCSWNGFILCIVVSLVRSQKVKLTYLEDGVTLYEDNGSTSGCFLNLGCFPYWCLGNISLCHDGLSVAAWIKSRGDVNVDMESQVILSSGGHRVNNDGFYIIRKLSDQFTIGIVLEDKHWRSTVQLETGSYTLVTLYWDKSVGLSVYIDGFMQTQVKEVETTGVEKVPDGVSTCLVLGQNEFNEPITSSCTYDVSEIILTNSKNISETQLNVSQRLFLGCASASTVNPLINIDPGRSDPVGYCRLQCYQQVQRYAFVNGSKCACSNITGALNATKCDGSNWSVYYASHVKWNPGYKLTLTWIQQSKRNYTKPLEDILFNASIGYNMDVVYTFTFDDGIVVNTSTPPVSHSWLSAGQHSVTVSAQIGVVKLNASAVVTIQDVDEGRAPDLVSLTVNHGGVSLSAEFNLTVIDERSSNCLLSYGDGKVSPSYAMVDFSSTVQPVHDYDQPGLYVVSANCSNAYGNTSSTVSFWAKDLETDREYVTPSQNYALDIFGDQSFYSRLDVRVNNARVNFSMANAKTLQVRAKDVRPSSDNVLTVSSDGMLMHRQVLSVRSPVDRPTLMADKTAGAWNLTVKLTVWLNATDHVWLIIDYGTGMDNSIKTFYVPEIAGVLRVDDTMLYGNLGDYVITVTASNEVSSSRSQMDISVQIPVFDISIRTRNITSLQQNAAFELRVNSGQVIPEEVIISININYGDGTEQQFFYQMTDQNYLGSYIANHTYANWGIYRVRVRAVNNISQDEDQALIQVGENITFVDITTVNERVSLGENFTVAVSCPTGSNVRYRLDFGDGTVFTFGELSASFPPANGSSVVSITETEAEVAHVYARAGTYNVKVGVSNEFGSMSASLCPTVVVADPGAQYCSNPVLTFRNIQTSMDKPLVRKRSWTTIIPVDVSVTCSLNSKPNMTFSWKSFVIESVGAGKVVEKTLYTFCSSKQLSNTLKIEPLTLPFGQYKLTVTASPSGYDLAYSSDSVFLNVVQSDPVAIIAGEDVRTVMLYATAIFDLSGCYDPDLDTDIRRDLTFHLFFMPETLLKIYQKLSMNHLIVQAELITNRTLFRSTTANRFNLYQIGTCFRSITRLVDDLSTFGGKVTFAADNFASNQFSLVAMLWVERNGLSAMTYQIVEIRSSNTSLDDLGSLLDLAKNADPDTAIRLLGGAASAILNQDTSSAEAQQKLAESTEAVVHTLGTVAKRIDSPNQASKCASAIKTMTSNKDIVNEGSRSSAAGAFNILANGTSNMPEATVEDASSFAGECLGGLGNIFPTSQSTSKPAQANTVDETTTELLTILSSRSSNGSANNNSSYTTPPLSLATAANSTAAVPPTTTTTAAPFIVTRATTSMPMPTATTTTLMTTPQTTIIHTTVGTTLSPSVGASFVDNGDNFTISGITVGTLQLNASKNYTTPQPFTMTTIGTTSNTPAPPVTLTIDDRMFEPRSDPRTPYQIAHDLLRKLPSKDTYKELFSYIFNDCLLFRQVMKSPEIQYNAINMMRCDGEFTLQDRVFDIMTFYEHPDDIYEVYLVPLDRARNARDRARKATDKTVATAGLSALSTIAESIGNKTHAEDTTERSFATPRLGMKLAKVAVANFTNGTDTSNNTQTMALPTGGFDVPKSIFQGLSSCASANTMFLSDSDNPFTFSDDVSNVGKGVLTLSYSCNGEQMTVEGTQEPIVLWMDRDSSVYEESYFVLITNTKTDVWSNFNYHPVNLTDTNSSLQVVLEPQEANSEYYVYMKFGARPNLTYYDFIGSSPNDEATHLPGYSTLNDTQKQQLRYTVTFPLDMTASNGTYWVAVKYKRGNIQLEDTTANSSYNLLHLISGCRFWDDTNNTWSSEGCQAESRSKNINFHFNLTIDHLVNRKLLFQVGPLTTKYKTQCLCNHLTSFGTDAVVAPNTIDFNNVWAKFANLSENAAVFATVISVICLYLVLVVVLRHFDKLDLIKVRLL